MCIGHVVFKKSNVYTFIDIFDIVEFIGSYKYSSVIMKRTSVSLPSILGLKTETKFDHD